MELPAIEAAYNTHDLRNQVMRQHNMKWENISRYELCADRRQHTQGLFDKS